MAVCLGRLSGALPRQLKICQNQRLPPTMSSADKKRWPCPLPTGRGWATEERRHGRLSRAAGRTSGTLYSPSVLVQRELERGALR